MLDERRFFEGAEIRMTTDSGKPVFEIQAIVFDKWSQNLGGFVETVKRSAWDSADTTDIRGLFNHDPNFVLGRTKAGTMQIDVRSDSAWGIVTPPDTQWAKDLAISVERGDINGSSFGFRSIKGTDKWDLTKPVAERTITQFQIVRDFSVVTYPAYQQTNAKFALRSAINAFIEHPETDLPDELRHQIEKMGLEIPAIERQQKNRTESTGPAVITGHARRARLLTLQNTH
jgi:HK97 family phage prohead protease